MGFWAHCTISVIRNPQNSLGNYYGPCITHTHVDRSRSPELPETGAASIFRGFLLLRALTVWGLCLGLVAEFISPKKYTLSVL